MVRLEAKPKLNFAGTELSVIQFLCEEHAPEIIQCLLGTSRVASTEVHTVISASEDTEFPVRFEFLMNIQQFLMYVSCILCLLSSCLLSSELSLFCMLGIEKREKLK